MNDTTQEKENEYALYDEDSKEEKIKEFIYSSFLVLNNFKPCKKKNPENKSCHPSLLECLRKFIFRIFLFAWNLKLK